MEIVRQWNFKCNFPNAPRPALANRLPGVGLVPLKSWLSCVGGKNDVSSAITEEALFHEHTCIYIYIYIYIYISIIHI